MSYIIYSMSNIISFENLHIFFFSFLREFIFFYLQNINREKHVYIMLQRWMEAKILSIFWLNTKSKLLQKTNKTKQQYKEIISSNPNDLNSKKQTLRIKQKQNLESYLKSNWDFEFSKQFFKIERNGDRKES